MTGISPIQILKSRQVRLAVKIIVLAYVFVCSLIITSNLGLFDPNWPFELFASYTRHVLITAPIIFGLTGLLYKRRVAPLLLISAVTFWPFVSFNKFTIPDNSKSCEETCITFVSANLRHDFEALKTLSKTTQDTDLIALLDLPHGIKNEALAALFPNHQNWRDTLFPRQMTILSQKIKVQNPDFTNPRISTFEIISGSSNPVSIYAIHPDYPMSAHRMGLRNQVFTHLQQNIGDTENFIILGDFNAVPWTPAFKELPGMRVGDPRFEYSWDATRPWLGIPIDHFVVGRDINVISASTGSKMGSDHLPILATFRLQ